MNPLPQPELPYLTDRDVDRRTESSALKSAIVATTSDPRRSACADATQRRRIEAESLQAHAGRTGRVIEPFQFIWYLDERTDDDPFNLEGGSEHDVVFDPDSGRVIKLTRPGNSAFTIHQPTIWRTCNDATISSQTTYDSKASWILPREFRS